MKRNQHQSLLDKFLGLSSGWNYKALALGKIPNWGWHFKDFKSECLRGIAETFNWNLVRTSTFALLPAWIALEAIREQLWIDYATVKDGGSLTPDLAKYAITPLPPSVEAEFARLAKAYRSSEEEVTKALLEVIGMNFIENSTATNSGMAIGVEVVFESVVRESWTAFEDLVRDKDLIPFQNLIRVLFLCGRGCGEREERQCDEER